MTKRLDALQAREYEQGGEKRTAFTRIGAAFETRNGGWSVVLDAMPAPVDGQFKVLLMEPKPKDGQAAQPAAKRPDRDDARTSYGGSSGELDDEVPFAPEWR